MKYTAIIISAFLFIFSSLSSQTKFAVNVFGGYTLPAADLSGKYPDELTYINFRTSKTLLTSYGINLGIKGKFAVDSAGSQILTAGAEYNTFTGNKEYPTQTYKNKVNIFTFNAGVEYDINPSKKFVPFIGLDLAVNFFSGKTEGSGDSISIKNRKSETRFGIIAGAGVDIKMWSSAGIVIGMKYALSNLLGKKSETVTTVIQPQTDDEQGSTGSGIDIPLNDESISGNQGKTINYIQFYVGISYYFGNKLGQRKF